MEERLKAIITKVEQSDLSLEEKEKVYRAISEGLRATVLPILLKCMPQGELDELTKNPETITVDRWVGLVGTALKDERVGREVPLKIDELIVEINGLLAKEGIK